MSSTWCNAKGCRKRGPYRTSAGLKNHQNACKPYLEEKDRIYKDIQARIIAKRRRIEDETAEREKVANAAIESADCTTVEDFIPSVSLFSLCQSADLLKTHV